ncbi:methylmalonyl-CoA mutase subunit beta [Streptomyces sp. P38-E01]|uniref:methylmalonyl-CoA mutase n=1 Tax=Streptomyces tardus TaxID=2780544 RepID=A0A949JMK0_9ACTN|nr:methylmalonyl-CoA mutase family protein [Streptomyces tardus]MBU7597871.1 methylmalonyl-CoA mutase subunit beta [Streptomyces tardus]
MTVQPDDGLSLAADFPSATREEWQRLVEGVLVKTGASDATGDEAEEALFTPLEDELHAHPLYTAEDAPAAPAGLPGFAPYVRGGRPQGRAVGGWDVRQQHRSPHASAANELVLADLENGVTSLWLVLGAAGLPVAELPTALNGVYLDLAPVVLDAGEEFEAAAEQLFALHEREGVAPSEVAGNLGADPLGLQARTGATDRTSALLEAAAGLAVRLGESRPQLRAMTVDALPYHEAGGSPAQELGCSLATGVAYLRQLTAAGLSAEQACAQLEFRYAATADQFTTVAKLRAARRLWARVAEVCSVGDSGAAAQRQHVVTSPVMVTRRDPWVNMLRTTVATLAAGVGGADSVTVLPFDHAVGLPDGFARRIARNTSTIMIEESHVARVVDPAGGSWYVERLTDELARAGWEFFQQLEGEGGQRAALDSGFVRDRLAETWERRRTALARRREPVTGVSEFPALAEEPVRREPAPESPGGGLPRVRRDEEYEALRARSDAALAATGVRPRVLLAALGTPAAYTARATFVSNLLQAGGIEPLTEEVRPGAGQAAAPGADVRPVDAAGGAGGLPPADGPLAALLRGSGTDVVFLCSSDRVYAEQAAPLARAFRAAGARRVLLAGRPGEDRAELEAAGVDEFVGAGVDAVALLTALQDGLLPAEQRVAADASNGAVR